MEELPTSTYTLTTKEIQWSRALKHKLERSTDSELKEAQFSDYEIVQFAICAKGDFRKALKRMKKLRRVKKQYISDEGITKEEYLAFIQALCPGMLQAADYDSMNRQIVCMAHYYNFDPAQLQNNRDWNMFFKTLLDLMDACTADLDMIRRGIIFVAVAENIQWKNFSMEVEQRISELYQNAYPVKIKAVYMVDAPFYISLMLKFVSLFLKKKLRQRIHITTLEDIRKNEIFGSGGEHLPTVLGGNFSRSYSAWIAERLEYRAEIEKRVVIP